MFPLAFLREIYASLP